MAERTEDINLLAGIAEEEVKTGVYRRKLNLVVIGILLIAGLFKDSGTVLTESKFKNDGKMTITAAASASDNFGKMVDMLTSEEAAKIFGTVNLTSMTLTKD